jgi:hypothetical protein
MLLGVRTLTEDVCELVENTNRVRILRYLRRYCYITVTNLNALGGMHRELKNNSSPNLVLDLKLMSSDGSEICCE